MGMARESDGGRGAAGGSGKGASDATGGRDDRQATCDVLSYWIVKIMFMYVSRYCCI
jgi:hypothetical protein